MTDTPKTEVELLQAANDALSKRCSDMALKREQDRKSLMTLHAEVKQLREQVKRLKWERNE